MIISR